MFELIFNYFLNVFHILVNFVIFIFALCSLQYFTFLAEQNGFTFNYVQVKRYQIVMHFNYVIDLRVNGYRPALWDLVIIFFKNTIKLLNRIYLSLIFVWIQIWFEWLGMIDLLIFVLYNRSIFSIMAFIFKRIWNYFEVLTWYLIVGMMLVD